LQGHAIFGLTQEWSRKHLLHNARTIVSTGMHRVLLSVELNSTTTRIVDNHSKPILIKMN